jgi:hypothetical protein
MEKMG